MPSLVISALVSMCLGHVTLSVFFLAQGANKKIPPILYPLIRIDSAKHAALAWIRWKRFHKTEDLDCYESFRQIAITPWVLNDGLPNDQTHAPTCDRPHAPA